MKQPSTLSQWLQYIEALHPQGIAMGLARVAAVAERLAFSIDFPIITVAGTNGKGSTCAMLTQIYLQAGYRVGTYSSPHLLRYNERVKINQQEASDEALCAAFAKVEAARGDTALTYFEIGTLAAMWLFCQSQLDVLVLEVGLGGRLDAVNLFEPTCSIVTSVDLDHMDYLGDTREKIGFEKAGVFRANKPAICGDLNPPQSVIDYAKQIGADFKLISTDFFASKQQNAWHYEDAQQSLHLPMPNLTGDFQCQNAACAIQAVMLLQHLLPVAANCIAPALQKVTLTGRFQCIQLTPKVIVDVAHNPHAAHALVHNLNQLKVTGRTLAVFAMLADKDIKQVINITQNSFDGWYLADIKHARGAQASMLAQYLTDLKCQKPMRQYENVALALAAACQDAHENDKIIVFGSFFTVAAAMQFFAV